MKRLVFVLFALLVLVGGAPASDDPEPPGGGTGLQKLQGTWTVVRGISQKGELKTPKPITFTFRGATLTHNMGKLTVTSTLKLVDKNQPLVYELAANTTTQTRKMSFDLKKSELYVGYSSPKGREEPSITFDGQTGPVLVLKREKK